MLALVSDVPDADKNTGFANVLRLYITVSRVRIQFFASSRMISTIKPSVKPTGKILSFEKIPVFSGNRHLHFLKEGSAPAAALRVPLIGLSK